MTGCSSVPEPDLPPMHIPHEGLELVSTKILHEDVALKFLFLNGKRVSLWQPPYGVWCLVAQQGCRGCGQNCDAWHCSVSVACRICGIRFEPKLVGEKGGLIAGRQKVGNLEPILRLATVGARAPAS